MVMYTFRQTDYEKWLQDFAGLLNISLQDQQLLAMPAAIGNGYIQACNINLDLSYVVMDLQPQDDMVFTRMDGGLKGFVLSFNQLEEKKEEQAGCTDNATDAKKATCNNVFLSDANENFEFHIPAKSRVKRLVIFYSDVLINKYLPTSVRLQLESFAQRNKTPLVKPFTDFTYRESLKKIFGFNQDDPLDHIKQQANVIQLTERFLHSFLLQEQQETPNARMKQTDLESIHHIEQILSNAALEGFPSLESLAQEVFMSPSKLKKIFKRSHGYTLYDFYNKNRLQRAKEMISTGRYSIKHAGREIGFSNLSHFAKAFKKEFGLLPHEILKYQQ